MKNIKKSIIVLGVFASSFFILFSATAIPIVNGDAVLTTVENSAIEQEEDFINQLRAISDQLEKDGLIATETQESELQNFIENNPDFDELFYIDGTGFSEYITSDDFIQLLNDNYDYFLSNPGIQLLWNTIFIQEYVQSEEFINFMNSDEVQYILDNLEIDNQQLTQMQTLDLNNQFLYEEFEQENLLNAVIQAQLPSEQMLIYNLQSDVTLEGTLTLSSEEIQPTTDLLTSWIIIMVGILSWPLGVLYVLATSPIVFVYWFIGLLLGMNYGIWFPGYVMIAATAALLIAIGYVIIGCTCWPAVWPYLIRLSVFY